MHNKALNALFQTVGRFTQEENAAITYTVDWTAFLDTDTISSSSWSSEDSGATIANEANTTQQASVRLSGSIGRFRIINQIITAAGDTYERSIDLRVKDNSSGYTWDYWDYGRGYL